MDKFKIGKKEAFRIIGFKTLLSERTSIHDSQYSAAKTSFFKSMIENGQMATLRPLAETPYGYAAVVHENGAVYYYAGVQSAKPLTESIEEVLFPECEYLILSGRGGLSRLAFDRLEDQAFGELLNDAHEYVYTGGPIAEVLLNGNPADAEVEVWVPVHKRNKTM